MTNTPAPAATIHAEAIAHGKSERRALIVASLVTLALLAAGALTIPLIHRYDLKNVSIFYEQFAAIEPPVLLLVAGFAGAMIWAATRGIARSDRRPSAFENKLLLFLQRKPMLAPIVAALLVFAISLIGTDLVFHRYIFTDDEYSGWFQAVIFAHGKRQAVVPPDWCRWIHAITPTSIAID